MPLVPTIDIPGAPTYVAPEFRVPSFASATEDPGYAGRLMAGTDALQNAAAAKGLTRTGGTLKDFISYNQNFASQEYQNVYDRAFRAWQAQAQNARDVFAPKLAYWQALADASKVRGLAEFQRAWDAYTYAHPHGGGGGGGGMPIPPPPNPKDYVVGF